MMTTLEKLTAVARVELADAQARIEAGAEVLPKAFGVIGDRLMQIGIAGPADAHHRWALLRSLADLGAEAVMLTGDARLKREPGGPAVGEALFAFIELRAGGTLDLVSYYTRDPLVFQPIVENTTGAFMRPVFDRPVH